MQSIFTILAFATLTLGLPAGEPERREAETSLATTYNGVATYYYQNGAYGSCGVKHSDSDYIGALGKSWMQSGTNYCGRKIKITNTGGGQNNNGNGKSVTIAVADTCTSCEQTHIDLATGPFQALTGGSLDPPGKFNIAWSFV